jgi:RimJ/RimL family protein N-acetyltransferase
MPFGVAWTDDSDRAGFVDEGIEHHEARLREWQPDDWTLNLIAFHRGRPVGVQSVRGERFAERRIVDTGSWLGREFQGQGLGTEMRAAALYLAFGGLGAKRATSGFIAGNPQSQAVSRKLGYEIVGSHVVSPRGEPLEHTDLELRSEHFRSPVPVELVALAPLLPLFGAG